MPTMTKSPLDLAKEALARGGEAMKIYSCKHSRKDFTQPQLFAILVLRQFFRADYRKTMHLIAEWSDLREALGLIKTPHWTTLQKAHQRILKKGVSIDSWIASASEPTAAA